MQSTPFQFEPKAYPDTPGVYLMKDAHGRILYVGKAVSLRRRLASYFRPVETLAPKTRALVARIERVDTLLTATEKEALLLEQSLIKKHRPRYNIVLRDDKQYILFRLEKAAQWPRLVVTRRVEPDGSVYFGPFTSAAAAREAWKVIGRVFPLRKCSDRVFANRVRPCLYHYIGQCLAPCVLDVPRDEYRELVGRVEMLLAGRSQELTRQIEKEMHEAAEDLQFERAAILRDQLGSLRRTLERQAVVLPDAIDRDVIAVAPMERGLGLGVLFVRQGRLIGSKSWFFAGLALDDTVELLRSFLTQFYTAARFIPPKLLVPADPEDETIAAVLTDRRGGPVSLALPKTSAEKELVELARKNALASLVRAENRPVGELLQTALRLSSAPSRIECVDISHLGGEDTRAGLVVFEDGEPLKADWRVYNLSELDGLADDYRALAVWSRRRLESGPPWPDLLLVDGGRGQLAAVTRALELGRAELGLGEGEAVFPVFSIAKGATRAAGELGDSVFAENRKNPLPLGPGSPELLFLQRVRDATHDFVLGRQRRGRSKRALQSELLRLPGIGPSTARQLWERFDSLEAMLAASPEEIAAVPGLGGKRGRRVHEALAGLKTSGAGSGELH